GVLAEVGATKDETTNQEAFKSLVKDITLQIAAANPTAVSRDQVDPALVAKEKEIAADQFKDKPAQAVEKIVEGKMEKFFQGICLIDQGFVKNGELTVKEHLAAVSKELGDELTIRRFIRFQVGEA
ncbi:MAG: translation elongation factor Ts, partial [Limisphaerales bacterium]